MSSNPGSWAAGPAAKRPSVPARPDVASGVSVAMTPPIHPSGSYETSEGWKRTGAVLGVVWSFFFLLTIPGWIALSHFRKWKRNEIGTPYGLIWWGYGFGAVVVLGIISAVSQPT